MKSSESLKADLETLENTIAKHSKNIRERNNILGFQRSREFKGFLVSGNNEEVWTPTTKYFIKERQNDSYVTRQVLKKEYDEKRKEIIRLNKNDLNKIEELKKEKSFIEKAIEQVRVQELIGKTSSESDNVNKTIPINGTQFKRGELRRIVMGLINKHGDELKLEKGETLNYTQLKKIKEILSKEYPSKPFNWDSVEVTFRKLDYSAPRENH